MKQEINMTQLARHRDRREFTAKLFFAFQKWSGIAFKDTFCFTLLEEVKNAESLAAAYRIAGNQPSDLPERIIQALSIDIAGCFAKEMKEPQSLIDPAFKLTSLTSMAEMLSALAQNIELVTSGQKNHITKVFDKHYKAMKRLDGWLTY